MTKKVTILTPSEMINWGNPEVLTTGAKDIILYGSPGKSENYVFRFKLPKHFEIKPFILSTACFLTVIEGEILIGEGNQFIENIMNNLPTKSFCCIPGNCPVYFKCKETAILQFHGIGPINLSYVNKIDDPRNK